LNRRGARTQAKPYGQPVVRDQPTAAS
jgi:hypothetical protein